MGRSGGIQGLVALAIACACGDVRQGDDEASSLGTAPTGKPDALDDDGGEAEGTGAAESSSAGDEAPAGDDDATKLDVGAGEASLTAGDEAGDASGCDKVDFLFVIDNSGSMSDEQENLITNFPGFISTIQETLDEAQDYHLMVIDSDRWVYQGCDLFCGLPGGCLPNPTYQCGVTVPLECEDVLGAGVTYPRGAQATNADCEFATGARYMDTSEPDLAATFQCAARVGTGSMGATEQPMEAMVNAVTPSTDAFACNEGFLRDDAILVVTFITDEDDNAGDSGGTVAGWKQALVSAKGGDESAIVVLGLFGDNDQPGAICPPFDPDAGSGAEPSPRLHDFVESFGDHGVAGSVCAASYQQFFLDAVGIIDTTCEEFEPPG